MDFAGRLSLSVRFDPAARKVVDPGQGDRAGRSERRARRRRRLAGRTAGVRHCASSYQTTMPAPDGGRSDEGPDARSPQKRSFADRPSWSNFCSATCGAGPAAVRAEGLRHVVFVGETAVRKRKTANLMSSPKQSKGAWYVGLSYALWGFFPIYWKALAGISALQLICHRIVWSFLLLAVMVARSQEFRASVARDAVAAHRRHLHGGRRSPSPSTGSSSCGPSASTRSCRSASAISSTRCSAWSSAWSSSTSGFAGCSGYRSRLRPRVCCISLLRSMRFRGSRCRWRRRSAPTG